MSEISLGVIEARFADIIWENAPVSSSEIVRLSAERLGWKKSTTFTVLKRLCEKGLFVNDRGTVTAVISRDEFYSMQSERFVEETFSGSLPAFLAAFTARKGLSQKELKEIKAMLKAFEEEG